MREYEKFERWAAIDSPMSALDPGSQLHIYLNGLDFPRQITLLGDMLQVCRRWDTAEAAANLAATEQFLGEHHADQESD